jgi:dsRNA-specific ribonuclease
MEEKQNLSKSELAALDFMIAYMQDNNQAQIEGQFIGFLVSAARAVASAASAVARVVAPVAANIADAATRAADAITDAAPAVADVAEAVAAAGVADSDVQEVKELVNRLNSENIGDQLTLENLIKIRNQYSK